MKTLMERTLEFLLQYFYELQNTVHRKRNDTQNFSYKMRKKYNILLNVANSMGGAEGGVGGGLGITSSTVLV